MTLTANIRKILFRIAGFKDELLFTPPIRTRIIWVAIFQLFVALNASLIFYNGSVAKKTFSIKYLVISICFGLLVFTATRVLKTSWKGNIISAIFITQALALILFVFSIRGLYGDDKIEEQAEMIKNSYAKKKVDEWKHTGDYLELKRTVLNQIRIENIDNGKNLSTDSIRILASNRLSIKENQIFNLGKEEYSKKHFKKINGFLSLISNNWQKIFSSIITFILFIFLLNTPAILYRDASDRLLEIKNERRKSLLNQINIFSSIQHELGNKLPALKNDISDLKDFFMSYKQSIGLGIEQKIRNPLPGEDINEIDSIADVLNRVESKLNYSINIVDNAGGIIKSDPNRYAPHKVNLIKFLKEETHKHLDRSRQIEFKFIGDENTSINLDTKQFSIMINNFINNAIRHGFTDPNLKYQMIFQILEEKNAINLLIKNNGNPFPDSFSLEKYKQPFSYSGATGNTGLGGYIISNVLQNHNATLEIKKDIKPEDNFKVQFIIKFLK
jgi:signal transduction histidine kinase